VASWGWLQSLFFIVCLKQGHFFLSLFSSISMNFFDFLEFFEKNFEIFFLQNIMGRGKVGWPSGILMMIVDEDDC
jgi:hypothetical protein